MAAATAALRVPPPANTREQTPSRDVALTPADCWARHRWVRYRRLAEIADLRARIHALIPLKYGKYQGITTETIIAGLVRQLDILHAKCVTENDQHKLLLGEMAALAFRISATCGVTQETHKIVSIKVREESCGGSEQARAQMQLILSLCALQLLITRSTTDGEEVVGEQMIHW